MESKNQVANTELPFNLQGSVAEGWENVKQHFKKLLEESPTQGYNYAVYYKGQKVVDLYGGYADADIEEPYRENTLTQFYSAIKGISAICVAALVDRGLLDYNERVARYWPEFGVNGKESITVETLVSHQAGLYTIQEGWEFLDILNDPEKISKSLAEEKPAWEPGTKHGYHGLTVTMYMNELIRRVDPKHRTLQQFFDEEFAKPLDLDIFIGLPLSENYRTAKTDQVPKAMAHMMTKFKVGMSSFQNNNPYIRQVPSGSVNGFGTARGAAKLMGILSSGGDYKGKSYLSPKITKLLTEVMVKGEDQVLGIISTFGRGTSPLDTPAGTKMFGTKGYGGQFVFGDPEHQLGIGFLTNKMDMGPEYPCLDLLKTTYEAIGIKKETDD